MSVQCENCFMFYSETSATCPHCGHTVGSPAAEGVYLNPGTILVGRYAIGQVVGSGGFGIIYKAWDMMERRIVAIKEFFQSGLVSRSPQTQHVFLVASNRAEEFFEGKKRSFDEALRIMGFAGHPSIVAMLDVFEEFNTVYQVMEFLQGSTLGAYVEKNELSVEEMVEITLKIGNALKDLHRVGILHRDVSPDNIIIPNNYPEADVKLFDFGAARLSPHEVDSLQTRVMKPGFSPPEQYGPGIGQNAQTDIYALGATLYFLLTSIKPEEATNRRIVDNLPSPKSLNENVPDNVSSAVLTAMALDLNLRFKTVEEFQAALVGQIKALTPSEEMKKRRKKRRTIILASAACIVVGFAIIGYLLTREIDETTLPDSTIHLLYVLSGDEVADAGKHRALASVIEDFESIYPNVNVVLRGIEHDDYPIEIDALLQSGDYPAVFESTMLETEALSRAHDVSGIIGSDIRSECYFLSNYNRLFPGRRQVPVGFNVSAFYINRQLCDYNDLGVSEISSLLAAMPFSISDKGLSGSEQYIDEFSLAYGSGMSLSERSFFINNETGAYFSSTSEYYAMLEEMAGRFKLLYIDKESIPAEFSSLWSMMSGNRAEQKTAARFLQFMLGNNAQHALHISGKSGSLPLNVLSLQAYCEVYVDYGDFFVNIEDYAFNTR